MTTVERKASEERLTTGVQALDDMVGGGYYRGSAVLITGAPGTAKTTLSSAFAAAACERGERVSFVSLDEGAGQILRNLRSVGLDLAPYVDADLLRIDALQSRAAEPEHQASRVRALLDEHRPLCLVVDPISAFAHTGGSAAGEAAALDLVAEAKARGITVVATSLLPGPAEDHTGERAIGLSTVADTWIHLSYALQGGERNRAISIIKSRGTAHSSQMRELVLHSSGVTLADVYAAGGEVLMGTLRWEKERENEQRRETERRESKRRERELRASLSEMEARLDALRNEHARVSDELESLGQEQELRRQARTQDTQRLKELRMACPESPGENGGKTR